MARSALVAIAGLGGAVGSTVAAGIASLGGETPGLGMATESPLIQALGIDLLGLDSIILDGWDMSNENLFFACRRHGICPSESIAKAEMLLQRLVPRIGVHAGIPDIADWIAREAERLRHRKESAGVSHLILVNLCPTESPLLQTIAQGLDWSQLRSLPKESLSPSAVYFRLAVEAEAHFVNFTPNTAEVPILCELAERANLIYAGRDGKTGQTFIKTVLAPALRDKNLRVDGWFSLNLLGNADGRTLSESDAGRTKIASKTRCLSSILGYSPGGEDVSGHQVHIHFYGPRGDAKEAWDTIDFRGFLGVPMQMKVNWLGQDSILAAPTVIDLVRLVAFAAGAGCRGPLEAASYFFKDPVVRESSVTQHSVPDQFKMLLDFLRKGRD
jgi:myo-inositol-1-phosphate synthase